MSLLSIPINAVLLFQAKEKKKKLHGAAEILIKIPLRHRRLEYGYRFWRRNFYNNLYNDVGSSVISVRVSVLDKNTDNVEHLKVIKENLGPI